MFKHGWARSLLTWNYHNTVDRLYPNTKLTAEGKKNPLRKISSEKYFHNSRNRSKVQLNLEKETATHSSLLAWRIPWTEEPGGLQSMGSQRVRHNWVTNTTDKLYTIKNCLVFSKKNFALRDESTTKEIFVMRTTVPLNFLSQITISQSHFSLN